MAGTMLEDLKVGQSASVTKKITERDIELFGEVSGDMNPVHFDEAYAKTTMFKTRIAHGMLSASFFSTILGTQLPGPGTIYMAQTLRFKAPVKIGETVTATLTVKDIIKEKKRVTLDCVAKVGDTVVVEGEAMVMAPSKG
jgi:3-hydroxybutyryl-CoA dehydratase